MTPSPTGQATGRVTGHTPVTVRMFTQRFSSTPLGARLARHLALHRMHGWGIPYGSTASDTAALLVAELAANAVTHGRVPGRDFELRLSLGAYATASDTAPYPNPNPYTLRIDVSDARGERRPPRPGEIVLPSSVADGGRGLLLVEELADRWAVLDRVPVGKTVRAELDLPS